MVSIPQYFVRKNSTNYILASFNFEREGNTAVDQTPFEVSKANGANLSIGDDVSIGFMNGAVFIPEFSGDLVSKEVHETSKYTLESYGGRINRAPTFSQIFDAQTPEAIAQNIIDNQVTSLTYASSTPSGITIERFVVRDETPGEAMNRLIELLNWQIRTDNSKNFFFEPLGTTSNPNIIVVDTNSFVVNTWSESPNSLINSVTFIGGNAIFNTNQTFTATASQTVFTVNNKIIGNVRVTDNGTEQTGGIDGSTASFDYTVDFDNSKIVFEIGRTSGHSIIIYYDYEIPIKVQLEDETSIAANTVFSRKVTDSSVKTMADARRRARQILNNGQITKNALIEVNYSSDYQVGETVQTVDTFNSIDQQVVINKLTFKYPEGGKVIEVGNARLNALDWNKNLDSRLKKLESAQDNSDRIQKYILIKENINVVVKSGRTRVRGDTIGNSWIVGSSTNGIVGTNTGTQGGGQQVVGASSRVETIEAVSNFNDLFRERFNFTTFIDTGNTTANVDVANEQTTFTTGEVLQSLACQLGETITKATLTSDSTANLTFELSADGGSNFESVTSGTEHTFTITGTDLRYKSTASTSATISLLTISYE